MLAHFNFVQQAYRASVNRHIRRMRSSDMATGEDVRPGWKRADTCLVKWHVAKVRHRHSLALDEAIYFAVYSRSVAHMSWAVDKMRSHSSIIPPSTDCIPCNDQQRFDANVYQRS
jgi:hypothetical protein